MTFWDFAAKDPDAAVAMVFVFSVFGLPVVGIALVSIAKALRGPR